MDLSMLAPDLAKLIGVQPSTLVLLLFIANRAAAAAARSIPNDAVGFWGFVRQLCAIVGTEVASKVTKGITVGDAAKAAIQTPQVAQNLHNPAAAPVTPSPTPPPY